MGPVVHQNAQDFIRSVRPLLETREIENGLFLGMMDLLEKSPPEALPFMLEIREGDTPIAAAYYRERNFTLTPGAGKFAPETARLLKQSGLNIPGAAGLSADVDAFATEWARIQPCHARVSMNQKLYQLTAVVWPKDIPGKMRPPARRDLGILTEWIWAFINDALPYEPISHEQAREHAERRIGDQLTYIWEVDGAPTSMSALARPTRNTYTVNTVYTPPARRKRGYASALVAALSQEGLNRGKSSCVLYTDLANPTSNAIYQKIGYQPIADSRMYRFMQKA